MSKDQKDSLEMSYDVRLIERYIRKGKVDPKDYEAYLKKIPNDEKNAEYMEVYREETADEPTPHVSDGPTFMSA